MSVDTSIKILAGAVLTMSGVLAVTLGPMLHDEAGSTNANRQPASLINLDDSGRRNQIVERTLILSLPCRSEATQSVSADIHQIRLQSSGCPDAVDATVLGLTNLTNGNEATVFRRGDGAFTSDYIHLAEGENKIRVLFEFKDGTHTSKSMTITR